MISRLRARFFVLRPMRKAEKPFLVENLAAELKAATSVVLVNFAGLTVKNQQELKKRLKKVGAKMLVVKNTLLKLAGENAKIDQNTLSDSVLIGQTALIITEEDPIAPLQVLGKFKEEFEIPEFKVGIVEGSFQDKEGLVKLSKLPGKEVLYVQVVGAISSPLYGLVGTLQGNLQKLLYILSEAREVTSYGR